MNTDKVTTLSDPWDEYVELAQKQLKPIKPIHRKKPKKSYKSVDQKLVRKKSIRKARLNKQESKLSELL